MFAAVKLNKAGLETALVLQGKFEAFLVDLEAFCGTGTCEMAQVKTQLEIAYFYAKRVLAMKPENRDP